MSGQDATLTSKHMEPALEAPWTELTELSPMKQDDPKWNIKGLGPLLFSGLLILGVFFLVTQVPEVRTQARDWLNRWEPVEKTKTSDPHVLQAIPTLQSEIQALKQEMADWTAQQREAHHASAEQANEQATQQANALKTILNNQIAFLNAQWLGSMPPRNLLSVLQSWSEQVADEDLKHAILADQHDVERQWEEENTWAADWHAFKTAWSSACAGPVAQKIQLIPVTPEGRWQEGWRYLAPFLKIFKHVELKSSCPLDAPQAQQMLLDLENAIKAGADPQYQQAHTALASLFKNSSTWPTEVSQAFSEHMASRDHLTPARQPLTHLLVWGKNTT